MKSHHKGLTAIFIATAMYGLYGIYSRLIATGFSAFNQNWIRNIFVLCLACVGMLLTHKKWKNLSKKDLPWLISWNLSGAFLVILLFLSFNNMPIGTALFLLYAGGTIASYIGGAVFLKEQFTKTKIISVTLSLLGLIIVFYGQLQTTHFIYLLLGICTGILSAGWTIFPKKISHEYPKLQLIVFDASAIIIVNFLLSLWYRPIVPSTFVPLAWFGLLLYGLTQFFADILFIYGFRLVEVHVGSLISPLEAFFGALFAFIFFKETLTITTIVGGIVIICGALIPNFINNSSN